MAITDKNGNPCSISISEASKHETRLVTQTLDTSFSKKLPLKLIGDRAYDSDPLDEKLKKEYAVDLISPHKSNRKKKPTQDGRSLRRYLRRWKVERLFAWLGNFRRLVVRYEFHSLNFLSFILLACVIILLRREF